MRTFVLALTVCLATRALCATYNGTLTPTNGSATLAWSGGPITGAMSYLSLAEGQVGLSPSCDATQCDLYNLTVNLPAGFYATYPNYSVHVTINFGNDIQDLDLYVFDSAGNLVGASATGGTSAEDAYLGQLPSGNYQIQVVPASAAAATYTGAVTLAPEPPVVTGKARYTFGNFTFTTQMLNRPGETINSNPVTSVFYENDAEPRVVHDTLGNVYVAAIQAVPAGTDFWKSMDGGNTFTYLGQPDGTQAAAAAGAGTGVGLGGGDEDLIPVGGNNLFLTSLWLGNVTNCGSSDGATTWLCNGFGALPADDRQWAASYGSNIVYLTTKQLGTLENSTPSIYVAKSIDGGLTFPLVSEVTKPILGVQPGDQGNIIVDPNNGNVYTVFFGGSPNQVYMAKSSDGGSTWTLKLVYQEPSGQSLGHVFPAIAVDKASNLYMVFSDGVRALFTRSVDGGATWSVPVQVNTGNNLKTAMEPWVIAGDAGKVDIFFYGTSSASFMDSSAKWAVFMAQSQNALAKVPTFAIRQATDIMHIGAICINGIACAFGTRNLLEYFYPDTYVDGSALAAYPDDYHSDHATWLSHTWFLKQTGGSKIIGFSR